MYHTLHTCSYVNSVHAEICRLQVNLRKKNLSPALELVHLKMFVPKLYPTPCVFSHEDADDLCFFFFVVLWLNFFHPWFCWCCSFFKFQKMQNEQNDICVLFCWLCSFFSLPFLSRSFSMRVQMWFILFSTTGRLKKKPNRKSERFKCIKCGAETSFQPDIHSASNTQTHRTVKTITLTRRISYGIDHPPYIAVAI